jgi:hypothetical protein
MTPALLGSRLSLVAAALFLAGTLFYIGGVNWSSAFDSPGLYAGGSFAGVWGFYVHGLGVGSTLVGVLLLVVPASLLLRKTHHATSNLAGLRFRIEAATLLFVLGLAALVLTGTQLRYGPEIAGVAISAAVVATRRPRLLWIVVLVSFMVSWSLMDIGRLLAGRDLDPLLGFLLVALLAALLPVVARFLERLSTGDGMLSSRYRSRVSQAAGRCGTAQTATRTSGNVARST